MSNKELDEFLKNCHKDLSVEDFEGKKVPCIGFEGRKFDDMLNKVAGKPLSVDTNLNILEFFRKMFFRISNSLSLLIPLMPL